MKRLQSLLFVSLVVLAVFVAFPSSAIAHDRAVHDEELAKVLFGKWSYSSYKENKDFIALTQATYLALDQYNGEGEGDLEELRKYGVRGIPKSIGSIDFNGNQYHRKYTHMGWKHEYTSDPAHWSTRKAILQNTAEKVFGPRPPWDKRYEDKINDFCAIVYYTHVLGDHIEDKTYKNTQDKMPLAYSSSADEGIIDELEFYLEDLFKEQRDSGENSETYKRMMERLETLNSDAKSLVRQTGGVNTDERFATYHDYAEELLNEILIVYVPNLLDDEQFFSQVFYSGSNQSWFEAIPFWKSTFPGGQLMFNETGATMTARRPVEYTVQR